VPVGDDLLVATDVGVFLSRSVSKHLGRSWLKVGSGLPNAPVTELRWHAGTSTLFAANFGRGAWSHPGARFLDPAPGSIRPKAA
jgi:hypothetical protein